MNTVATQAIHSRVVSLDFGNYTLKAFNGRSLRTIRSLQTPLARGRQALRSDDDSPLVERADQRWHLGRQCCRYPSTEATVTGDKARLAQLHLAACLDASAEYRLVVSHHSPRQYEDFLKSVLLGEHCYQRNGLAIQAVVQSVKVVPEGWGAYQLARQRNYLPQRGYTVVVDLGGSTWLSSIYAADGELIDHDAHERQGVFALAAAIAKDDRLAVPLQERFGVSSPDPIVIQAGFSQDHFYGDSDLCWASWLPEYLDPWWKGIVQTLKARYQSYLPHVRRFLITGGGSHLVSHKVAASPAFLVMPEPSTANVQGAFFALQSALAAT
jgi:hypothetical protein